MKTLSFEKSSQLIAGDFNDRIAKQRYKCNHGSTRACKRMLRMFARRIP